MKIKYQPVLVLLKVPEDDKISPYQRGRALENALRFSGQDVGWAIPLSYTVDVPEGAVSAIDFPGVPA